MLIFICIYYSVVGAWNHYVGEFNNTQGVEWGHQLFPCYSELYSFNFVLLVLQEQYTYTTFLTYGWIEVHIGIMIYLSINSVAQHYLKCAVEGTPLKYLVLSVTFIPLQASVPAGCYSSTRRNQQCSGNNTQGIRKYIVTCSIWSSSVSLATHGSRKGSAEWAVPLDKCILPQHHSST